MKKSVHRWPSLYYSRFGYWGLLPFFLLTVGALYLIPRADLDYHLEFELPLAIEEYAASQVISREFRGQEEYILIVLSPLSPFSHEGLAWIEEAESAIRKLPGVNTLLSPLDPWINPENLLHQGKESEPASPSDLKETLSSLPMVSKLFLPRSGEGLGFYLYPDKDTDPVELAAGLLTWSEKQPEGTVFLTGIPVAEAHHRRLIKHSAHTLFTLAPLLLAAIILFLYRNFAASGIFLAVSLIPTLWTVSLFPLLHRNINTETLVIPIIVLALSTSYGLHYHRHRHHHPELSTTKLLDSLTLKIVLAGGTTLLGFAGLLFSPLESFRFFGLTTIAGIFFAIVVSLFALPVLLTFSSPPRLRTVPLNPATMIDNNASRLLIIAGAIILLFIAGLSRVYQDHRFESLLTAGHPFIEDLRYFNEEFGGTNEIRLFIDTDEEYGIIAEQNAEAISRFQNRLENHPDITTTISFLDFVEWLDYSFDEIAGKEFDFSQNHLGESLEILSSSSHGGLDILSLVNPSYNKLAMSIRFTRPLGREGAKTLEELKVFIENSAAEEIPGMHIHLGGEIFQKDYIFKVQKRLLLQGFLLFFPILLLLLSLASKSFFYSLTILIAPLVGSITFFGFLGWMQIPFSNVTLFTLACILGVSVDDAIFMGITLKGYSNDKDPMEALRLTYEHTGEAIIETTLVIVVVMASLFFSRIKIIKDAGVLVILSLSVTTLYTLFILPALIRRRAQKQRKIPWPSRTK